MEYQKKKKIVRQYTKKTIWILNRELGWNKSWGTYNIRNQFKFKTCIHAS